jgi:hypothetical protein
MKITLRVQGNKTIKTILNNGIFYEVRLPITPKLAVLEDAQSIINNLGDLRIK